MDEAISNLWKQGPLVGVLIIGTLGMYRYFVKEGERKDKLLIERDKLMIEMNQKFIEVIENDLIWKQSLVGILQRMDNKLKTEVDLTSIDTK